ncbi:hypothetical protein DXB28_01180 [Bacillus cereus]|nr:hypothetical protein DXB28_01180 [Bacillus cereus]
MMKWNRKIRISEKVQMILLTVSVIIMMIMFAVTMWSDLFHKDDEIIRQEHEREARRLQRLEMIRDMK